MHIIDPKHAKFIHRISGGNPLVNRLLSEDVAKHGMSVLHYAWDHSVDGRDIVTMHDILQSPPSLKSAIAALIELNRISRYRRIRIWWKKLWYKPPAKK